MAKMAMGTPKSPIRRRSCDEKTGQENGARPDLTSEAVTYPTRQVSAILELAQEVGYEEAAQHKAHG